MAAPLNRALHQLPLRLRRLTRTTSAASHQIRYASSRYSNPTKRTVTTAQTQNGIASIPPTERVPPAIKPAQLQGEEKRQYHLRRMRFAGIGLLVSLAGLAFVVSSVDLDSLEQAEKKRKGQQLDASNEANATFQGKEVHVLGAGGAKKILASGTGGDTELVETGTSSVPYFPRTIFLPSSPDSDAPSSQPGVISTAEPNARQNPGNTANEEEYTLIGLGIRTVLFIQVYVVGMYIRTTDISSLQEKLVHHINPTASALIPSEKEGLRNALFDPEQSRAIWNEVLKVPGIKTAFRISPTRNTDFGHLRDGFVTGINKRAVEARKLVQGRESEYDSEDFGRSVQSLKAIFAGGKAPKGSILILLRDAQGALNVLYQAKPDKASSEVERLGAVPDERVSRLLWFGYLAGAEVSSKGAREGVVNGCMEFVERPVGSVETMVH